MAASLPFLPDWTDEAAYAPLASVEASGFAWEWLRRDRRYASEAMVAAVRDPESVSARRVDPAAAQWGLHSYERPDSCVLAARPVWTSGSHAHVLEAAAHPANPGPDAIDLASFGAALTAVSGTAGDHLLFSDGVRSIRLDIVGRSLSGPVRLIYLLSGLAAAEGPLLVLRRFLVLCRTGRFSPVLHRTAARAARQILLLRTSDALAAGASQREIAAELVTRSAAAPRWRIEAASARLAAQRLVRDARGLAAGGWRRLLR